MNLAPRTIALLCVVALPRVATGEPTRELSVSGSKEVLEGDPESTSVDALGRIFAGPVTTSLHKGGDHPALSLLAAKDGQLWIGTAGGGLLRLGPSGGNAKVIIAPEATAIAALAERAGVIYAGKSPEGEIVQIDAQGQHKPFMKLEAKYVWALLPDGNGLLAATGEPGKVLRLVAGNKPETVFDPDETHVRALIRHEKRGLVAGSGQKGIVYQLDKKGGYALYDSEYEEVTALASDNAGNLYAAFVSETKAGTLLADTWIGPAKGESEDDKSPFKGSEVVRIRPDGQVDVVFTSKSEGALALVFDEKDKQLQIATGTGKKGRGRVYSVDAGARDRLLLTARIEPSLATTMIAAPTGGALLVASAPAGQLFRVGPGIRGESVYLSSEQDLSRISTVGRLWFDADLPQGASIELSARTGNTKEQDATWSEWSRSVSDKEGGEVKLQRARYVQLRAVLKGAPKGGGPLLKSLHASIQRNNLAPRVQEVFLLRRGVYMATMPAEEDKEKTITVSKTVLKDLRKPEEPDDARVRVRQGSRPGMMTVAWSADDANGDTLIYALEKRRLDPVGEWTPVEEGLIDSYYSFDSRAELDGRYQFRVTASDRPSNPPADAHVDRAESEPFIVDNSPPVITAVKATSPASGRVAVEALAEDQSSLLGVAEISIDAGPWLMFPARDGLLDSKRETLSAPIGNGAAEALEPIKGGRHSIQIRVEDEAGNVATAGASVTTR